MELTHLADDILKHYAFYYMEITKIYNTSRSSTDTRFVFVLDEGYVLKVAEHSLIDETNLSEIAELAKRYKETGIEAPRLIKTVSGSFSVMVSYQGKPMIAYVETYIAGQFLADVVVKETYQHIKNEVFLHLGIFAQKYKNKLLTARNSMWSLLELAPLDEGQTETSTNLNLLIKTLKTLNVQDLANNVEEHSKYLLSLIKQTYNTLPRATIQSDLNDTNILVHENKFTGLIDFNLYGNETNINNFLNETMYFIEEEDIETLTALDILNKMQNIQEARLDYVLTNYILSEDEKRMMKTYQKLIFLSFYPNVIKFCVYLKMSAFTNKIQELIKLILVY